MISAVLSARPASLRVSLALAAALSGGAAQAQSPGFALGGPVRAPSGYTDWCNAAPKRCIGDFAQTTLAVVTLTDADLATLKKVNAYWNRHVVFKTDLEAHGVVEDWRVAVKGRPADCEDVMLRKRKDLIKKHMWPGNALLMTLVRDRNGDGHAVLVANTDRGMLVLDNLTDEILAWHKTGLTFRAAMARGVWREIIIPGQIPQNTGAGGIAGPVSRPAVDLRRALP